MPAPIVPKQNTELTLNEWFTATGLDLPSGKTEEEKENVINAVARIATASNWWQGDGWNDPEIREYGGGEALSAKWNVEYGTLKEYGKVSALYEKGDRSPFLSWTHHQCVAYDPDRLELLEWAEENNASVRDLKEERNRRRTGNTPDKVVTPEGLYDVIVLDPPWPYEDGKSNSYDPKGRRVANPYPEMPINDIASMGIPAGDNCVMWLWTTHRFLPDSFDLLRRWGFEYKATMVWDKKKIGMGRWLRMQTEFCLLAIKGNPEWSNTSVRDIMSVPRREHSRKPDEFYEMVEDICDGKKFEFFAREDRDGWDQLGNQKDKF